MLFFFDLSEDAASSEVTGVVESHRIDARTFQQAIEITACRKRSFLTIGSDPSHLRVRNRKRCSVVTKVSRTEAFTESNEIIVTTTTESVSV